MAKPVRLRFSPCMFGESRSFTPQVQRKQRSETRPCYKGCSAWPRMKFDLRRATLAAATRAAKALPLRGSRGDGKDGSDDEVEDRDAARCVGGRSDYGVGRMVRKCANSAVPAESHRSSSCGPIPCGPRVFGRFTGRSGATGDRSFARERLNSRFLDYPLLMVGYWTVPWEVVFRRIWALFAQFTGQANTINLAWAYSCVNISRMVRCDCEHQALTVMDVYNVRGSILMIRCDKVGKN
jgi:hypothetical protein